MGKSKRGILNKACISGYISSVNGTPVPLIKTNSNPLYRNDVPIVTTSDGIVNLATK